MLVLTLRTSTSLDDIIITIVSLARVMVGIRGATEGLILAFEKQLAEGTSAIPTQPQGNVAESSVAELHALSFVDLFERFTEIILHLALTESVEYAFLKAYYLDN